MQCIINYRLDFVGLSGFNYSTPMLNSIVATLMILHFVLCLQEIWVQWHHTPICSYTGSKHSIQQLSRRRSLVLLPV